MKWNLVVGDGCFFESGGKKRYITKILINSYVLDDKTMAFKENVLSTGAYFSKMLKIPMFRKFVIPNIPAVYVIDCDGIKELYKGKEIDVTNSLMNTVLKDVLLEKVKVSVGEQIEPPEIKKLRRTIRKAANIYANYSFINSNISNFTINHVVNYGDIRMSNSLYAPMDLWG